VSPDFDKAYWELHWQPGEQARSSMESAPPHPYLAQELGDVVPGTALDAGCGAGAEAMWLASRGWSVTAADISAEALAVAAERARVAGLEGITWVEADLGTWVPATAYDLVTTHYAHPQGPQLDFYERLARWVAPGGTLLVVGHATGHGHGHGHSHGGDDGPPAETMVTAAAVADRLAGCGLEVVIAEEASRETVGGRTLHDVVVRAVRA
jgi:SAM-dependent methyltransferase